MPRNPNTGERTADTGKQHRTPVVPYRRGTIAVPASYAMRKLYERMQHDDVHLTTGADFENRRVDDPVQGQAMVMPRDEREAKYERPLMFADFQPGKSPLLVMGMAASHWQELKEIADETRHYGKDVPQIDRQFAKKSPEEYWHDIVDMRKRYAAGRKTYGASPKG